LIITPADIGDLSEVLDKPVKNHRKYLGMDIHSALAAAQQVGEQLRVMTMADKRLRYADAPDDTHILVHVKNGIITSTS
jgi:hypothetical protein